MTRSKQLINPLVHASGQKISLGKYQHYKGALYQVLGVCTHTETSEELVYYQALYGNYTFWARPIKTFFEEVEDGNQKRSRFTFIKDT